MRQVLLYPESDGGWVVECPSLPGCVSQGENRDEAVDNIKEAIEAYIEVGATHFVFSAALPVAQVPGQVERLATQVISRFR